MLSGPTLKRESAFAPFAKEIQRIAETEEIGIFPRIQKIMENYFEKKVQPKNWETAKVIYSALEETCNKFYGGIDTHITYVVNALLNQFKQCEKFFEGRVYDDAVAVLNEEYGSNKETVVQLIYSHTQLIGKSRLIAALLKRVGQEGMHLVTPLAENLREIGNMFHTDEVSEQCRRLLLQNNCTKYRKFLNKIIWDIKGIPLAERDYEHVLPVNQAIFTLRDLFAKIKAEGVTPKDLLTKSPWVHKVLHEFFFNEDLGDYAVRAYIERQFFVCDVEQSTLSGTQPATIYDFTVDNDNLVHYMISPTERSNQYLSIVKFSVNVENFYEAVTHQNLVSFF